MVLRMFGLTMFLWDSTGQYLNLPQGGDFALPPACTIFYVGPIHLGLVIGALNCSKTPGSYFVFLLSSFYLLFFPSPNYLDTLLQNPFSVFLLLPLGTAISISPCFSILLAMGVQTCGQSWTSRASCATRKGCDTSPSGAGCTGAEPKEATSPSGVPCHPPALLTAGWLC